MESCLVCNSTMRARKAWLRTCPTCGFMQSTLAAGGGTEMDGLADLRERNFEKLLDRLGSHISLADKHLLDVGCARGRFLAATAERGAAVTGIEATADSAAATGRQGFRVIEGLFPNALPQGQRFDIIVFNDVFEHLPDPVSALHAIEAALEPNGILVLNLPNSRGTFYRLSDALDRFGYQGPLERLWQKHLKSPHMTYFDTSNLPRLLHRESNLRLVYRGRLDSVTGKGLYRRTTGSFSALPAMTITATAWILLPFLRFLPPDIIYQFYRKS